MGAPEPCHFLRLLDGPKARAGCSATLSFNASTLRSAHPPRLPRVARSFVCGAVYITAESPDRTWMVVTLLVVFGVAGFVLGVSAVGWLIFKVLGCAPDCVAGVLLAWTALLFGSSRIFWFAASLSAFRFASGAGLGTVAGSQSSVPAAAAP